MYKFKIFYNLVKLITNQKWYGENSLRENALTNGLIIGIVDKIKVILLFIVNLRNNKMKMNKIDLEKANLDFSINSNYFFFKLISSIFKKLYSLYLNFKRCLGIMVFNDKNQMTIFILFVINILVLLSCSISLKKTCIENNKLFMNYKFWISILKIINNYYPLKYDIVDIEKNFDILKKYVIIKEIDDEEVEIKFNIDLMLLIFCENSYFNDESNNLTYEIEHSFISVFECQEIKISILLWHESITKKIIEGYKEKLKYINLEKLILISKSMEQVIKENPVRLIQLGIGDIDCDEIIYLDNDMEDFQSDYLNNYDLKINQN